MTVLLEVGGVGWCPRRSVGGGAGGGAGWDPFLTAVRTSRRGRGGHRHRVEGGDMAVVTDLDAGTVGFEPVPGDHNPCVGGDVAEPDRRRIGSR